MYVGGDMYAYDNTLHRHSTHLSLDGMREYLKKESLELPDTPPFNLCKGCVLAKSTRQVHRISHMRVKVLF